MNFRFVQKNKMFEEIFVDYCGFLMIWPKCQQNLLLNVASETTKKSYFHFVSESWTINNTKRKDLEFILPCMKAPMNKLMNAKYYHHHICKNRIIEKKTKKHSMRILFVICVFFFKNFIITINICDLSWFIRIQNSDRNIRKL